MLFERGGLRRNIRGKLADGIAQDGQLAAERDCRVGLGHAGGHVELAGVFYHRIDSDILGILETRQQLGLGRKGELFHLGILHCSARQGRCRFHRRIKRSRDTALRKHQRRLVRACQSAPIEARALRASRRGRRLVRLGARTSTQARDYNAGQQSCKQKFHVQNIAKLHNKNPAKPRVAGKVLCP